ncbi:Gfo/Idh/MocA family protein [Paenarthrobacter sp. NPDC089714]|uniref:Gfo/Idh/MocA family protein n=1 Tax=Paenarthrobacter sp. NPDC089714 TaxID=3364377 RepID=UPI003816B271
MPTKILRIGLIGAGMAGQAHAFGYRNASMADPLRGVQVELAHVVDAFAPLAQDVAERYGFEKWGSSVDELLADPSIDAVSVALPNNQHVDVLTKVLASGKHVLTEKPLGLDGSQASQLAALAADPARKGTVDAVGFSYRRIPGLAALRDAVAEGAIGEILHFEASYYSDHAADPAVPFTWRFEASTSGGGALIDIGAHALDAIEFVVGPVREVQGANFATYITERKDATGTVRPVTNDDAAAVLLVAGRNAMGVLQTSRVAYGRPNALTLTVFGVRGSATFSTEDFNQFTIHLAEGDPRFDGPRRVITGPLHGAYSDVSSFRSRGVGTGYGEAFIAQVQAFLGCIVNGTQMETNFAAAAATMRILDAANEAAATGRAVPVETGAHA